MNKYVKQQTLSRQAKIFLCPSIHVCHWKLFLKVQDYIFLGSCPEIPCWKQYPKIFWIRHWWHQSCKHIMPAWKTWYPLTLFRMGFFGAAHDILQWWNSVELYLTQGRPKKYINHVTSPLSSAGISIFSTEISKFCCIKK